MTIWFLWHLIQYWHAFNMATIHLLLLPDCKWAGDILPFSLCACRGMSCGDLNMVLLELGKLRLLTHSACIMSCHRSAHTHCTCIMLCHPSVFTDSTCIMSCHPNAHTHRTYIMFSNFSPHTSYLHYVMPPHCLHSLSVPASCHATHIFTLPAPYHAAPVSSGPCFHSPAHFSVRTVHHWQTCFLWMAHMSHLSSKWTGTGSHQSVLWTQGVPKIQHTINLIALPNFHIPQFPPKTAEVLRSI
jgi:hypothetical protein